MIRELFKTPWAVLLGVMLGIMTAPAGQSFWRAAMAYYDQAQPVVVMSAQLVDTQDDTVRLRISGEKRRACTYLRMQAYARSTDGSLGDAYTRREDHQERGDTKPTGLYDIGVWSVWPVSGAVSVLMVVQHDCNGRIVLTKIAEVSIPTEMRR